MEDKITLQRLRSVSQDRFKKAERYYSLISSLNDLRLTERELQLVAYTAIRGNMSYGTIREDFCKEFKTSSPTINNMISRLKKLNVLIKDRGKIKVNPKLLLNFDKDVVLQITLKNE
jgi:hypothetical protein